MIVIDFQELNSTTIMYTNTHKRCNLCQQLTAIETCERCFESRCRDCIRQEKKNPRSVAFPHDADLCQRTVDHFRGLLKLAPSLLRAHHRPCRNIHCRFFVNYNPITTPPAMKKCNRCFQVCYCSPDCQTQDWKLFHKDECISTTRRTEILLSLVLVTCVTWTLMFALIGSAGVAQ